MLPGTWQAREAGPMEKSAEHPLVGGAQTEGLVRVGDTTRRPAHHRAGYVDALLRHLAAVGFTGAPRPLGYDDQGRHILTFVEGEVPTASPYRLSDRRIRSATALIRAFHDAAATSGLCADQETVCHGDLGPHNMVFRDEQAIALIDFDAHVGPGRRVDDFAHAVWCFADLTEQDVPVTEQRRKTNLMCEAYGGVTAAMVVEALTARFHRAHAQHLAAGRQGGVRAFEKLLRWMAVHGERIAAS
jgi:aminoglycoside phosphotransferase (APT) family kinase protein